jgi:cytochrome c oxidase accessory protein FixG
LDVKAILNLVEYPFSGCKMSEKIPLQDITPDNLAPAEISELDLYQKREKIYTRKIEGFFQRLRMYTGWPLLLGYFILPWLQWEGHQAVLFDLPARKFYILWFTFWPQDFPLLAWLLIIAAFTLFTVTVWAGRVWCGYTCPQTVWTAIFMWIEQFTEGSRNQRIKLDNAPWSAEKVFKKTAKHIMWVGFALFTGYTFVGYFADIRNMTFNLDFGFWEIAWITFFTSATYINAGWLREQVCIYMCPYARFQSVMFDKDSLIVSYNAKRGEPRGARKHDADLEKENLGHCIDCHICVQVCPTGIDIRDGLQIECINCALCVDGCDSVMDKMGYPRGLISYTTENALAGKPQRILRPRLIGYCIAVVIMFALFITTIVTRVPLQLDVVRPRDKLYDTNTSGMVVNSYTLKVINMDKDAHDYSIDVTGLEGVQMEGEKRVHVGSGEIAEVFIRLTLDPGLLEQPTNSIEFSAQAEDDTSARATVESRFIGPSLR